MHRTSKEDISDAWGALRAIVHCFAAVTVHLLHHIWCCWCIGLTNSEIKNVPMEKSTLAGQLLNISCSLNDILMLLSNKGSCKQGLEICAKYKSKDVS